jgi:outer membrane scaffolding protein for murein synthesis (MipA/OmpV family)
LSTFVEITDNTRVFISTGIEFLDSDVRRSPIVGEDHVLHAFVALTYAL